ncbi:MAG: Holliday junction resolvase RuvX [Gemmatimonadaceae bacterium]|nr:Holliday junction resolvase RuvX [Gloeobacterales cyanobacterium ES-bin-141]
MISALGLDVGDRRIGVAGCDATGLVATPLATITRSEWSIDVQTIRGWIRERRAETVVIGLPRNMNGSIGPQALRVQKFGERLALDLEMPIDYVDERLSTVQAERSLRSSNISSSKRRSLIDQQAAAVILQQWLDTRRQQSVRTFQEFSE